MWCREGVQAESSGMPLARSPSGWDRLHRHDFKREKIAVMSPAEAAASLQGNISSSSSPFCGMGEKHMELSCHFHAALTAFVHVKSKGNTLKIHNHWGFFGTDWDYNNKYVYHGCPGPKQEHVRAVNRLFSSPHRWSRQSKQLLVLLNTVYWQVHMKPH